MFLVAVPAGEILVLFFLHEFCCFLTDFLFKYLVIGSAGTGKSCILHQFIENKCKYKECSSRR